MTEKMQKKTVELTDEEAGKAAGGIFSPLGGDDKRVSVGYHICEHCGHRYEYTCYGNHTAPPRCPKCNYNPVTNSF